MIIYSSDAFGQNKIDALAARDMSILISTSPDTSITKSFFQKDLSKIPNFSLDNGGFNTSPGNPFNEYPFLKVLNYCISKLPRPLEFIALPDILAGGRRSLDFSLNWSLRLPGGNLALIVQDGMIPEQIPFENFKTLGIKYLFVGGSITWKFESSQNWIQSARKWNLRIHCGQIGRVTRLSWAEKLGFDSVDSSSFSRRDKFDVVDEFRGRGKQTNLFRG